MVIALSPEERKFVSKFLAEKYSKEFSDNMIEQIIRIIENELEGVKEGMLSDISNASISKKDVREELKALFRK